MKGLSIRPLIKSSVVLILAKQAARWACWRLSRGQSESMSSFSASWNWTHSFKPPIYPAPTSPTSQLLGFQKYVTFCLLLLRALWLGWLSLALWTTKALRQNDVLCQRTLVLIVSWFELCLRLLSFSRIISRRNRATKVSTQTHRMANSSEKEPSRPWQALLGEGAAVTGAAEPSSFLWKCGFSGDWGFVTVRAQRGACSVSGRRL